MIIYVVKFLERHGVLKTEATIGKYGTVVFSPPNTPHKLVVLRRGDYVTSKKEAERIYKKHIKEKIHEYQQRILKYKAALERMA